METKTAMNNLSTTPNEQITALARKSLSGNWALVVGATLALCIINITLQNISNIGPFIVFVLSGPMSLGFACLYLTLYHHKKAGFSQIFSGFNHFIPALIANSLITILVFLWSLLLIIPGIIAAYSYCLTFYIIYEDPSISPIQAMKKSKLMMEGNKLKAFYLSCRFIGWLILAILTSGIGFLWLAPYVGMSFATFYEDIKQNAVEANDKKTDTLIC